MSQVLNVLRCFSCKMYQVHIVKKAKKWQCKICNVKQSFRRVFFQGSGKDCRTYVQKLNAMKAYENEGSASFEMDHDVDRSSYSNEYTEQSRSNATENEWTEYLNPSEQIQYRTFKTSNNITHCFKENDDSTFSHTNNTEYECLQADYTDSNSCYEKELTETLYDDNESKDDTVMEQVYNISSNNTSSQNNSCSKKTNETKEVKNIFDDNEEFDLAIDF